MAQTRVSIPTVAIAAVLVVAAFTALIVNGLDPTVTPSPTETTRATPSPSLGKSPPISQGPGVSPAPCTDFFTPPPYDTFSPVPGILVRAIDKGQFEITNATSRSYYFGVSEWITEDNLVCGRGVTEHRAPRVRLRPGVTVKAFGGSTPEIPVTVAIWVDSCGQGCNGVPIGE